MGNVVKAAAAEVKREKARQLRLKRPACKELNWDSIRDKLIDIQEDVGEAQWSVGNYEKLYEALGEDDEAVYEFQIAFSDLAGECDRMYQDMEELREREEEVFYGVEDEEWNDPPALFNLFFPAINYHDRVWGYDIEEHDYYGFESHYDEEWARDKARSRLKRLTKDQIISLSGLCLEIARQYMSLTSRYDALSTAISILKGESEALLRVVERIDTLYSSAEKETDGFRRESYYLCPSLEEFDKALEQLPERLWVE